MEWWPTVKYIKQITGVLEVLYLPLGWLVLVSSSAEKATGLEIVCIETLAIKIEAGESVLVALNIVAQSGGDLGRIKFHILFHVLLGFLLVDGEALLYLEL